MLADSMSQLQCCNALYDCAAVVALHAGQRSSSGQIRPINFAAMTPNCAKGQHTHDQMVQVTSLIKRCTQLKRVPQQPCSAALTCHNRQRPHQEDPGLGCLWKNSSIGCFNGSLERAAVNWSAIDEEHKHSLLAAVVSI